MQSQRNLFHSNLKSRLKFIPYLISQKNLTKLLSPDLSYASGIPTFRPTLWILDQPMDFEKYCSNAFLPIALGIWVCFAIFRLFPLKFLELRSVFNLFSCALQLFHIYSRIVFRFELWTRQFECKLKWNVFDLITLIFEVAISSFCWNWWS